MSAGCARKSSRTRKIRAILKPYGEAGTSSRWTRNWPKSVGVSRSDPLKRAQARAEATLEKSAHRLRAGATKAKGCDAFQVLAKHASGPARPGGRRRRSTRLN